MSDIKSVAILGVGKMGAAIAKELAVAGFEITLWNRNQEVAEKLASEINMTTVKVSPTPKSALANADLAICLFTNGIVTQSVLLDDPEVLKDVQSNLIVVDMGTSGVESARSLASALAAKEISFIDAPVSGSVATIAAHQLLVMASGDKDEIEKALDTLGAPYVVKDDGLAAGKGVVVTNDRQEALAHALSCKRVVIEEFLNGPEVSLFGISDGTTILPMQPAQDFKRAYDGDKGPNTGGMGAYSPLPWAPSDIVEDTHKQVLAPMIAEMAARGTPFVGLLYAGLALTDHGTRVIEFNARFGDPETQVLIPRLKTPLATLLYKAATGNLAGTTLDWKDVTAVTVVLAAQGYPTSPISGSTISGFTHFENVQIYHAGTLSTEQGLASSGGRVLTITGIGEDLTEARNRAYRAISQISLTGSFYRSDIALNASVAEKGN